MNGKPPSASSVGQSVAESNAEFTRLMKGMTIREFDHSVRHKPLWTRWKMKTQFRVRKLVTSPYFSKFFLTCILINTGKLPSHFLQLGFYPSVCPAAFHCPAAAHVEEGRWDFRCSSRLLSAMIMAFIGCRHQAVFALWPLPLVDMHIGQGACSCFFLSVAHSPASQNH